MRVKVASPCPESWETMRGDERVRFCARCSLNVYNLSGMASDEAERIVQKSEGRLCVHYYQRRDGTVLTQDCPVGFTRRLFWRIGVAALLFLGLIAVLAFSSDAPQHRYPDWFQAVLDWVRPAGRATTGKLCR